MAGDGGVGPRASRPPGPCHRLSRYAPGRPANVPRVSRTGEAPWPMRDLRAPAEPPDRGDAGRGAGEPAEPEDPEPGLDQGHQLPGSGHRAVPVLRPGERWREVLPGL